MNRRASIAGPFFENDMNEFQECYNKAIDLLAMRDHSARELGRKLYRYEFDKEVINSVIEKLVEKNYINESEYSRVAIRSYAGKRYSKSKIIEKLNHNGVKIDSHRIEETFEREGINYQDIIDQNVQKVLRSLNHKNLSPRELETKVLSRMYAKGFSLDEIRSSFNRCVNELS